MRDFLEDALYNFLTKTGCGTLRWLCMCIITYTNHIVISCYIVYHDRYIILRVDLELFFCEAWPFHDNIDNKTHKTPRVTINKSVRSPNVAPQALVVVTNKKNLTCFS